MTRKKFATVFIALLMLFTLLEVRLFFLMNHSAYTVAASQQGIYNKTIAVNRPDFYDCNGIPLTGTSSITYAIADPLDAASYKILEYVAYPDEESFQEQMRAGIPFLVAIDTEIPASEPIKTIVVRSRYAENGLARHLIGYTGFEGDGVSGLEYVLDSYLTENATQTKMSVAVNALGRAIDGSEITFFESGENTARVDLTIDKELQAIAETIADEEFEKGAIVILDAETFEIRALVSRPNFLQNDVAAAMEYDDGALLNRALNAYNIGSVYKPLVAAAALEAGVHHFSYDCTGEIDVDGHIYTCNDAKAHGYMDMESALEQSCNTYFIALGQYIGSEAVYNMAAAMGLGRPINLYDSFSTAKGYLPTVSELKSYGELCNNCFGQGKLLSTPVHVAAYTACIANGGVMRDVSVIKSIGGEFVKQNDEKRVLSQENALFLTTSMTGAVRFGTGEHGAPSFTSAAGKTGTAQTGIFGEDGTEKLIGWFTGWFPADNPKYVVTVMTEDAGYSYESAAPVFKQIADTITLQQ